MHLRACAALCLLLVPAVSNADGLISEFDLSKVVGTEEAKCAKCHPSEVAQWEKTTHFKSTERLAYSGNSKKYADALGISADALKGDSVCADCHATKAKRGDAVAVISGVSCESCHGPSKDWLDSHGSYSDGYQFTSLESLRTDRKKETAGHKSARLKSAADAGMIRPKDIHKLGKNCLDCHMVDNEKLIAAGHKAFSAFELHSWSGGEVRHNFFMDAKTNAAAPSLWMEEEGRTAAQRDRIKFVAGTLTQIEMGLRRRANAKNPAIIPQLGGNILATNGRLSQIIPGAPIPEVLQSAGMVGPLAGTLFAPLPTDQATYTAAADKLGAAAKKVVETNDGSALGGLDASIKALPLHYSTQYKQKHGQ